MFLNIFSIVFKHVGIDGIFDFFDKNRLAALVNVFLGLILILSSSINLNARKNFIWLYWLIKIHFLSLNTFDNISDRIQNDFLFYTFLYLFFSHHVLQSVSIYVESFYLVFFLSTLNLLAIVSLTFYWLGCFELYFLPFGKLFGFYMKNFAWIERYILTYIKFVKKLFRKIFRLQSNYQVS